MRKSPPKKSKSLVNTDISRYQKKSNEDNLKDLMYRGLWALFISPIIFTLMVYFIFKTFSDNYTLIFIFIFLVGFTLYITKCIIFKKFSMDKTTYMVFYILLKTLMVTFGILGILSIYLFETDEMIFLNIEENWVIIDLDLVYLWIYVYGIIVIISITISEIYKYFIRRRL